MCRYRATPNNFIHYWAFFSLDIYEGHSRQSTTACVVTSRSVSSPDSIVSLNFIITSIFDEYRRQSRRDAAPAMTFDWNTEYFVVALNCFRTNPINAFVSVHPIAVRASSPTTRPFNVICVEFLFKAG